MAAIVTELEPEDIPVVVEWFATQAPPKALNLAPNPETSAHYAELGCDSCHADADGAAPHLTAQHPDYLKKQMLDFLAGDRMGDDIAATHNPCQERAG